MNLDGSLVGHWSSLPFSYGVMEASELGLLGDGRGWSTWFTFDALCVTRLVWRCPEPGVVELRAQWMVEGTLADGPGPPAFSLVESITQVDDVTRHPFVIGPATPLPGADAVTALNFDEPVEFCSRYARMPGLIRPEDDPSHHVLDTARKAQP
ncbi:hypothetical protein [Streptomyces sp. NPDC051214]|uniref:hypothetical protein n=1 Tax=Streptomyces sp. NPDC051214 TaxID=3155282 RepID=UPI00343BA8B0